MRLEPTAQGCCRNQPNVHEQKLLDNADGWHGAELSVVIAGNWQYYRAKVLKYLQQIAVITPYSQVGRSKRCQPTLASSELTPATASSRPVCSMVDGRLAGQYYQAAAAASVCICICVMCTHIHATAHLLQFRFAYNSEDDKNNINIMFARRTSTMPQPPKVCMRASCVYVW